MIAMTIFGLFCVLVLFYAGRIYVWLMSESQNFEFTLLPPLLPPRPLIVESYCRVETLQSTFEYIDVDDFERNRFYMNPVDFNSKIITSNEHKKHMIEDQCYELTKTMLKNRLIEIYDVQMHDPEYHPYFKTVILKVKVLSPE